MCECGDIRLILRQRIDDLSSFGSTAGMEYGQREESLARGATEWVSSKCTVHYTLDAMVGNEYFVGSERWISLAKDRKYKVIVGLGFTL